MSLQWMRRAVFGLIAAMTLGALFPVAALAHEPRDVGAYHLLVGWINEPAIENQPNAISIRITAKANGQPVTGAEKTLKVAAAFGGGQPRELDLEPSDEVQGLYTASLIPTRAGTYTFTFTGSIGSQQIDERFQSGPNTFDDVVSPTTLDFPTTVPAPADLAQQSQTATTMAQGAMQRATILGFAGIAVGLVGLIVAVIALVARVRPVPAVAEDATLDPAPERVGHDS